MQGYHDLDANVHITHRSPHKITIQAHTDEEVHVVSIVPYTYCNVILTLKIPRFIKKILKEKKS